MVKMVAAKVPGTNERLLAVGPAGRRCGWPRIRLQRVQWSVTVTVTVIVTVLAPEQEARGGRRSGPLRLRLRCCWTKLEKTGWPVTEGGTRKCQQRAASVTASSKLIC